MSSTSTTTTTTTSTTTAVPDALVALGADWRYEKLDPDVFGEAAPAWASPA